MHNSIFALTIAGGQSASTNGLIIGLQTIAVIALYIILGFIVLKKFKNTKKLTKRSKLTILCVTAIIFIITATRLVKRYTYENVLNELKFDQTFKKLNPQNEIRNWASSKKFGGLTPFDHDAVYIIKENKSLDSTWLQRYSKEIKGFLESKGATIIEYEKISELITENEINISGYKIIFSFSGANGVLNIKHMSNSKFKDKSYLTIDLTGFRS